jgi:hypothetical protein
MAIPQKLNTDVSLLARVVTPANKNSKEAQVTDLR